jgi:hypothetical protein
MQSRKHHLSHTESTLGCTVTVHDAQSLRTTSETQVKLKCSARQLAAVEQVFLAVLEFLFLFFVYLFICHVFSKCVDKMAMKLNISLLNHESYG